MSIRYSYIVYILLTLGLLASIVPYLLGLGGDNIFIKDFYAKRIMAVSTIPLIAFLLIIFLYDGIKIKRSVLIYILVWIFYTIYSITLCNNLKYLSTDAYVAFLPIFFMLAVGYLNNTKTLNHFFVFILLISTVIVSLGIKLQYSYLSIVGIIFILFFMKINYKTIIFILLLPIVLFQSLIGKSAALMFLFLVGIVLLLENKFLNFKTLFIFLILIFFIGIGSLVFGNQYLIKNHSYQHFVYFISHADFDTFEFNDASTGNRLFEAIEVLSDFKKRTFSEQFYGKGFGSTIDLSNTMDNTVLKANVDPTKIHHIHMGFFAVLYRYGYIGVLMYLMLTIYIIKNGFSVFKNSNELYMKISALYLFIIIFDSHISFPHMMSNYFFWFTFSLFTKEITHAKIK